MKMLTLKVRDSSSNSPSDGAPCTVVVEHVIGGMVEIPKPRHGIRSCWWRPARGGHQRRRRAKAPGRVSVHECMPVAARGTMAMVRSSVPALVRLRRAGGGGIRQQLRCDEAPGRASVRGGAGHCSCLREVEPEYWRVSPAGETACVNIYVHLLTCLESPRGATKGEERLHFTT